MVALQETVALPDPVRLFGVIAPQVRLEGIVSVRLTIPEKWLIALIVIVDGAEDPMSTGAGDDAPIVKF
jgi:hypothetical protein